MILVTGATGHFGNAVINFLLEKGVAASKISALVRDTTKAKDLETKGVVLKQGNYKDYTSLVNAFKGVDKLLFVSGSEIDNRLLQHENVVKAAKETEVKHVIYTSSVRKNETETSPLWSLTESHILTEKWIKESGLTYTFVKNNFYLDVVPLFIGEQVLETETIYLPAGTGKVPFALRSEFAEATANIIASSGHENKAYDFTNTEAYSYNDVAKYISKITGKTINYVSPDVQEFEQTLTNLGVPSEAIVLMSVAAVAQASGEQDAISGDLEKLLGRKPVSLETFLKDVYGV